jgi:hypothetical protein
MALAKTGLLTALASPSKFSIFPIRLVLLWIVPGVIAIRVPVLTRQTFARP